MPKAITSEDVRLIVNMIREWPKDEPFKWDSVCLGCISILGYKPSRQILDRKPAIANAYSTKKKLLRTEIVRLSSIARPRSMLHAIERIARLEEENNQLNAEIQKMAEIAQRFIYNASVEGLTREQLMKPLPRKN